MVPSPYTDAHTTKMREIWIKQVKLLVPFAVLVSIARVTLALPDWLSTATAVSTAALVVWWGYEEYLKLIGSGSRRFRAALFAFALMSFPLAAYGSELGSESLLTFEFLYALTALAVALKIWLSLLRTLDGSSVKKH